MTRYRITYGDPTDPLTAHTRGERVEVVPMDADGTRELVVIRDDEEPMSITVGPGHILGYEKLDD